MLPAQLEQMADTTIATLAALLGDVPHGEKLVEVDLGISAPAVGALLAAGGKAQTGRSDFEDGPYASLIIESATLVIGQVRFRAQAPGRWVRR